MKLGAAHIIRADARKLPLADNSVDLVVTSPPYFALRSYQDGGEHYAGQIGSEPTPAEFVAALLEVTRECVRVLKPSGSLWVNLGDKYASSSNGTIAHRAASRDRAARPSGSNATGVATKSLIGIPWRYALACIDDLGLILRAELIWSKPNGLPESVTDRVRRSHEQWFHFTLEPRYFSAVTQRRGRLAGGARVVPGSHCLLPSVGPPRTMVTVATWGVSNLGGHLLGKLPGSVWTVATEPLRVPDHLGVNHFAAFPTAWPRKIIQGWCPEGLWTCHCGQKELLSTKSCACCGRSRGDGPATQGVVLDPFGGTGTTAMVAKALGRIGISVDMSGDYCRLAEWRTNDRDQLAKVLGVAKAEQQDADQLELFEETA